MNRGISGRAGAVAGVNREEVIEEIDVRGDLEESGRTTERKRWRESRLFLVEASRREREKSSKLSKAALGQDTGYSRQSHFSRRGRTNTGNKPRQQIPGSPRRKVAAAVAA